MIRVRLQIADGTVGYTDETYGLVYISSDNIVGAPTKGYESTAYPEEEGEHILPKTVDDAFDYKVKFFIQASTLESANEKIVAFNEAILPYDASTGTRHANQITFYNDYKRHKIVGYPQPISEATDFWRDKHNQVNDVVVVEWTIRVTKPSLCDFNI